MFLYSGGFYGFYFFLCGSTEGSFLLTAAPRVWIVMIVSNDHWPLVAIFLFYLHSPLFGRQAIASMTLRCHVIPIPTRKVPFICNPTLRLLTSTFPCLFSRDHIIHHHFSDFSRQLVFLFHITSQVDLLIFFFITDNPPQTLSADDFQRINCNR